MYTVLTTDTFDRWLDALRDRMGKRRIQARIDRIEDGHFGDCKPVGKGVSELRLAFGPGYRVYFMRRGLEVIVLLCGGDKSSQSADIQAAQMLAAAIDCQE